MKAFNVITGLPRSGSTLLCNILNQNPDFYASSTSPLSELLAMMVNKFSTSPEVQAGLVRDSEAMTDKCNDVLTGIIEAWHADQADKVVFDKSRGWSFNALLLQQLCEGAKVIVTVRDLRGVFGSVEKQHRRTALFDASPSGLDKTIFARADAMFAPTGMIGQCAVGVEDIVRRFGNQVYLLQYEAFTLDPAAKLKEIYKFLEIEYFTHDFDNVENVAEDVDGLYLNKFPHEGSGKVTATNRQEWQEYVTPDIGSLIYGRYPAYNEFCGYQ